MSAHGGRSGRAAASFLLVIAAALVAQPGSGQVPLTVQAATVFESYSLSPSLDSVVENVSEVTIPVVATARVGGRAVVSLASGYTRVSVGLENQETSHISGLLDTELRLEVQALRDRVTLFTTASFPTGMATLASEEVAFLGVLTSDVIGFSAPNLGGGGAVGGGLAAAVPFGRMALGLATSFSSHGTYAPVEGQPGEFRPGPELRLRVGIEGPVGQRSFLRVSGILAHRGDDQLNGIAEPSVGDRISAFVSLERGLGSSTLLAYAFNMFRSASGLESTPIGTTVLNRGNVLVLGAQWSYPIASGTALTPRLEFRDSRSEVEEMGSGLQPVGRTTRIGVDLRRQLGERIAGVLKADGLFGSAAHTMMDGDADVRGYRLTLQLEAS